MKKIVFLLAFAGVFFNTAKAQKVEIKGILKNMPGAQMVYFNYSIGDERIIDSTPVLNGKFEYKQKMNEVRAVSVVLQFEKLPNQKNNRRDITFLYMEPGKITVEAEDSLKNAIIKGSKAQIVYEEYKKRMEPYSLKEKQVLNEYMDYMKTGNVEGAKKNGLVIVEIRKDKTENVTLPYIMENPSSPITLSLLIGYAGYDIRANKIEPLFESLPLAVQNSPSGIAFRAKIEEAKKTGIGVMAIPFTQNDTIGNPVSLASFKGKYVFLDFWASWCAPCRHENPYVVKAFNKYKDNNFTVLGVSLDGPGKHQAWMDAIHKDGLTWTHISDLKLKENAVAKLYGIAAIPQNFLIDPSGMIIAKNLKGEELLKKLSEIIPEK